MADLTNQENLDSIAARIAGPQPARPTFGQAFSAVRADERFGHAAIDNLLNGRELERRDREQIAALGGWDADAELRKAISGLDPDEAAFVVENGRRGPVSLGRALARLQWRRETDQTVARAGGVVGTLARVAADLTNPVAAAAGMLGGYAVMGGRAMLTARAGSVAVRTATPGARAVTRIGDEIVGGVAGSLVYSGVQDTLGGQVMDLGDYAMDAAADAAGTVALFGAVKGASWAVRRLAGMAHAPGAPNTVGALRAAGLEPPFDPATAPKGEAVAAKAIAEIEAPAPKATDDLFDEEYRKTLVGEAPAEAPAAPPVAPVDPLPTPPQDAEGIAFPDLAEQGTEWAPTGGSVQGAADDPVVDLSWREGGQGAATHRRQWEALAEGKMGATVLVLFSGQLPRTDGKIDLSDATRIAPAVEDSKGFVKRLLASKPVGRVALAVHPEAGAEGIREAAGLQGLLRSLVSKYMPDSPPVYLAVAPVVSKSDQVRGIAWGAEQGHIIGVRSGLGETVGSRTLIHEFGHVLTFEYGKFLTDREFSKLRDAYRAFVETQDPVERALRRYAPGYSGIMDLPAAARTGRMTGDAEVDRYFTNMAEFAAEQFVKFIQKDPVARGLPERLLAGVKRMVSVVMRAFTDAKHQKLLDPEEAFEDFFQGILDGKFNGRKARAEAGAPNPVVGPQGEFELDAQQSSSVKAAGKVVGSARAQATDRMRQGLYARAVALMSNQPIRTERLRTMNQHLGGGLSDGLILAGSQNPGIQMLATRLTETTTGAAGRGNTAAVLARVAEEKIAGNVLRVYTSAWHEWASAQGISWVKRFGLNDQRTRFDQAVQAELYRRRTSTAEVLTEFDPVRRAADALDAAHTRAAAEGRAAGILGANNLPDGPSRGYWTQRLDGRKIIEASPTERATMQEALARHFEQQYTLDPKVAAAVADVYVRNAVAKIHGTGTVQVDTQGSVVRSIREEMEHIADGIVDPVLKQQLLDSTMGMSNTRRRLDIPWDDPAVAKFFDSDLIGLNRGYTRRMAAEVATTRVGLLGLKGVRELRAASLSNGPLVSEKELQSLDRVIAELFGTPVPGAVTSVAAQNARTLTAAVRLGGAVFAQAGDLMNVAAALGVPAAFRTITNLPRLVLDIKRMVAGGETTSILQGVDRAGGKIGLRDYLIEAPLAPSDDMLSEYTRTPGIFTQLVQHVGYASQSINFFRAFLAVQHRHVAEELLKHVVDAHIAGRALSTPLKDMGFTDELVRGLGPAITRGRDGRVLGFDPALLPEQAAQRFMVSLHRGVGQMIQHNFVGENSSWAHNDWVKIMTQFRTFSLTANEKQIARRRANAAEDGGMADGYAHIAGHLAAQMAVGSLLYLARVQVGLLGLDEQERAKKAKQALSAQAIAQGALNASTLSGFSGDVLSAISALKGWLPDDVQDAAGLRGGRPGSLPATIPAVGLVEQAGRTIQDPTVRKVAKLLPGANAPLMIPFVNMLPN
jgi:hypothetical protein